MVATSRLLSAACLCCAMATPSFAQTDIRPAEWSRGTTLSGFAGVARDSSHTGPVVGGVVGWEVTPRLALEGSGAWFDFGQRTTAFGGAVTVRARLFGQRTVDPFVQAGVGLYRASFGPDERAIPDFYKRRMDVRGEGVPARNRFTDPTLLAGGGVNIFLGRHVAVRPDVAAAIALRDGRRHVVTMVALHGVYHFEHHPVTPAGKR